MGSRFSSSFSDQATGNYARNRSEFNQAQKAYQSKLKFGKSSTREGGLSEAQIGEAPTMQFSRGFAGQYERSLDARRSGGRRERQGFGFGAASQLG